MADIFLREDIGIVSKVIFQFAVNEGQLPTERIGKKGLAGTVWADDGPLFVLAEGPGSVWEDETIAQTEGGVMEREKWFGGVRADHPPNAPPFAGGGCGDARR